MKIAGELERALARREAAGASGVPVARLLAQGPGWSVEDVLCTSGPRDRPFEEQHEYVAIALVVAGSFQYRSLPGRELMTPGSVMLGNVGQPFECGHEHSAGDRCISFRYAADYFEDLTRGVGLRGAKPRFGLLRVPPVRALSSLMARAGAALEYGTGDLWEELSIRLAGRTLQLAQGGGRTFSAPPSTLSRITRVVRRIEREPDGPLSLPALAREAGLSPYHFLRTFHQLTGVSPHQYVRRLRLRAAAARLAAEPAKVLDVALDCGFGDVSNFNHAFRAEFGVAPRQFRAGM